MSHIITTHATSARSRTAPWQTVTDDDGRVWPIPAGGSSEDEDDDDEDDEDDDAAAPSAADLEKWKRQARKWEKRAKDNQDAAAKLQKLEDEGKSDVDRLTQQVADLTTRAKKAEAERLRLTVALEQAPDGMPLSKVRKLADRLRGDDEDELKADADDLFADFTASTGGDGGDGGDGTGGTGDPKATPKPTLKPGTGSSSGDEPDPEDIVNQAMSSGF